MRSGEDPLTLSSIRANILLQLLQDSLDSQASIYPLVLLTLLVNYNRFEFQNPYQLRLENLASTPTINTIITSIGSSITSCVDQYSAVQEDQPEGWNLSGALSWLGLGGLARRPQATQSALTDEDADKVFAILWVNFDVLGMAAAANVYRPPLEATVLLSTYDAVNANNVFRISFVSFRPEKNKDDFPFGSYLSLSSYLLQHSQRSARASLYARLNLLTLQILITDNEAAGRLCSSDNAAVIRLCRQRQPVLPSVRENRPLAAVILDCVVSGIDHNLQQHIDEELYQ